MTTASLKKTSTFHHLTLIIFSFSLLLSAALMFSVQPMVGKILLPMIGGTPMGWIVAMAFFQVSLLAGYLIAHLLSVFKVGIHAILFLAFLTIALISLPIDLKSHSEILGDTPSAISILMLLIKTVALPFVMLSTVSSSLQRFFSETSHKSANDPYFLYAASNIGSFLGLFAYPIIIESSLNVIEQTYFWKIAYIGLLSLVVLCALFLVNKKTEKKSEKIVEENIPLIAMNTKLYWLALAFVPSSLLMGVTSYIGTDVVSLPMMWVIPLGLYLLTHILAFSKKEIIPMKLNGDLHTIICVFLIGSMMFLTAKMASSIGIVVSLVAFFLIALYSHQKLASIRPHKKYLTEFYLMMAIGGALGGVFNAFIAPNILTINIEYQLTIALSILLHSNIKSELNNKLLYIAPLLIFILSIIIPFSLFGLEAIYKYSNFIFIAFIMVAVTHISSIIAVLLAISIFCTQILLSPEIKYLNRNFFGVTTVRDINWTTKMPSKEENGEPYTVETPVRAFYHGTTIHGFQSRAVGEELVPTSYYAETSPVASIFENFKLNEIGVLGLGAGVLSCYTADNRNFTFYEIDQAVIDVAQKYFTFLKKCNPDNIEIILGDARLELEKRTEDKYNLLIADAFSSDSIPIHLVTVEAFNLYKERIQKDGMILINISNRYLKLDNTIAKIASEVGFETRVKKYLTLKNDLATPSHWIIATNNSEKLKKLDELGWDKVEGYSNTKAWTDDYSNFLSIIKF